MIYYLAQFFNLILFSGNLDTADILDPATDSFPHIDSVVKYVGDFFRYSFNKASVGETFNPEGGAYILCYALAILTAVGVGLALWKLIKKLITLGQC